MRRWYLYLLPVLCMAVPLPPAYAVPGDGIPAAETAPVLPHNHEVVEFDPVTLRVMTSHTYVIPVRATGCTVIAHDGFEFDASRIDASFVTTVEETRSQRVEGIREPIVVKICVMKIELTITGSLKGTHTLIYAPTGDVVATIKVSRGRTGSTIDLRK